MSLKARTAEATLRMTPPHTAEAGTSRMIELMEVAALRLMQHHLAGGQTSVGTEMNVTHRSTSPVYGMVRAVATYEGVAGRMHRFAINVFDESGLIGSAKHTRAVVIEQRLVALTRRRAGKPGMLLMV